MRSVALILVAFAGCGADPSDLSKPDLLMRDVAMAPPNQCANGFTDGEETDQDCGGPACGPCADGKACKMGRDCLSTFCTNNVCDAASCMDGVKNGTESDLDCGGSCSGCAVGKKCNAGTDCQSMTCTNGTCAASPCSNGKQDGAETDVDCGGGTCEACVDGKMCQQGTDCKSGTCTNNVCKSPVMCMAGTADCDGNQGNGCEVTTNTDARNCGGCAKVCANNTPTCVAGKCQAGVKVLLVAASGPKGLADVQQNLMMTGAFLAVDTFDASAATPSVMQLQTYSAVLTWSEERYMDAATLGDNLATFYDGGGRVVVAMFAFEDDPGYPVLGRFGTIGNGYLLIAPGRVVGSNDTLGKIAEPMSPLVAGVKSLTAGTAYATSGAISNGGVVVASWGSQTPLIVRGNIKGRNRVDLNMLPPSMAVDNRFWSGDGAIIMRNALLYQ